jgi:Flp pilus assembly protein CpaB
MTSKLFTTRQGTIFLGLIAAVIAAVALIVYLNQYRSSVNNDATSRVLVAKRLIQTGTPGAVIRSSGLYVWEKVPKSDITTDTFVDTSSLTGMVAATDIGPGDKLTAADFAPSTNSLTDRLNTNQRAIVIPLGSPQQVGGQIGAGSHVDVYVTVSGESSQSVVAQLFQDVYVLGVSGDNVTLRVTPRQAAQFIFASQNDQLWLVLRPTVAHSQKTPPVTNLKVRG